MGRPGNGWGNGDHDDIHRHLPVGDLPGVQGAVCADEHDGEGRIREDGRGVLPALRVLQALPEEWNVIRAVLPTPDEADPAGAGGMAIGGIWLDQWGRMPRRPWYPGPTSFPFLRRLYES